MYGLYDIILTISIMYYSWLHKNNLREVWRGWVTNLFSKYEKILLHNVFQLQNNPKRVSSWINVKFAFISLNQIYCTDNYSIGKRTGNEVKSPHPPPPPPLGFINVLTNVTPHILYHKRTKGLFRKRLYYNRRIRGIDRRLWNRF